jgi:hypothetical protein
MRITIIVAVGLLTILHTPNSAFEDKAPITKAKHSLTLFGGCVNSLGESINKPAVKAIFASINRSMYIDDYALVF